MACRHALPHSRFPCSQTWAHGCSGAQLVHTHTHTQTHSHAHVHVHHPHHPRTTRMLMTCMCNTCMTRHHEDLHQTPSRATMCTTHTTRTLARAPFGCTPRVHAPCACAPRAPRATMHVCVSTIANTHLHRARTHAHTTHARMPVHVCERMRARSHCARAHTHRTHVSARPHARTRMHAHARSHKLVFVHTSMP